MNDEADFDVALGEFDPDDKADFNVVIAYDTPKAAQWAMRLVDGLAKHLGHELNVHRNLWRFDVLGVPAAQGAATDDAANGNLIVVATARADLPLSAKSWLEAWRAESVPGTAALVALLLAPPASAEGQLATRGFLQAIANEAGQDFFAHEYERSSPTADMTVEDVTRAETSSPVLLGILKQQQPALGRRAANSHETTSEP
jgi:hypothetical protein